MNENTTTLILSNLNLAQKIAKSKKKSLPHISFDELESAAYMGLVEAANNYNPNKNDNFSAYAVFRIIGAVKDYLRELSWGKRTENIKMSCVYEKEVSCKENISFEEIIEKLPCVNKNVLKLYYVEGLKIKEIASDMKVHQSRVSQILSESRSKLAA